MKEVQLHGLGDQLAHGPSQDTFLHAYTIDCDLAADALPSLRSLLDGAEREHIRRIRHTLEQQRAAIRRGALRHVLGAYLQLPPECVPVFREPGGRSTLRPDGGGRALRFSCASSGAWANIVVGAGSHIGIDVELISRDRFPDQLADTLLHAREMPLFANLAPPARSAWLACAWVLKEATLKALGLGLSVDPRTVEVMTGPAPDRPNAEEFCLPGFPHFSAWLWREGEVITGMVVSRPSPLPQRFHLRC